MGQAANESPSDPVVAGLDIGGTSTSVILLRPNGEVLNEIVTDTPASQGGARMCEVAARLVQRAIAESGTELLAVGIGAAGVIDTETGSIVAASDSFHDWAGFPLATEMRRWLGTPVVVQNDVNAFAVGEHRFGALRGRSDALAIALGTGVGGALILSGELFAGGRGAAGEIGHTPGYSEHLCTCGQTGHLETLASGRSLALRYGEYQRASLAASPLAVSPIPAPTASEVAELARLGDPAAIRVFTAAGTAVALAIATAANLLDVSDVVLGGGVCASWDILEPAITQTLSLNQPVSNLGVQVHRAQLGGRAVALGAAATAAELTALKAVPHRYFQGVTSC